MKRRQFFLLGKDGLQNLEKLPKDVLKNIIIRYADENKGLKKEIKRLKSAIEFEHFKYHGR